MADGTEILFFPLPCICALQVMLAPDEGIFGEAERCETMQD